MSRSNDTRTHGLAEARSPSTSSDAASATITSSSEPAHAKGIHSLPNELLRDILEIVFYSSCSRDPGISSCDQTIMFVLLSTCSLWRATVFATPRLWTRVDFSCAVRDVSPTKIGFRYKPEQLLHTPFELIKRSLNCSQSLPIEIIIRLSGREDETHNISEHAIAAIQRKIEAKLRELGGLLSADAHRCSSLYLYEAGQSCSSGVSLLAESFAEMLAIRRIYFDSTWPKHPAHVIPTGSTNTPTPNIPFTLQRRRYIEHRPILPLPPQNLTHLELDFRLDDTAYDSILLSVLDYASQIPSLRVLKVHFVQPLCSNRADGLIRTFIFPSLEVLELDRYIPHHTTPMRISAPQLLYLRFDPSGPWDWESGEELSWDFPKLRSIVSGVLPHSARIRTIYFAFIIRHLRTLRSLPASHCYHPEVFEALLESSRSPMLRYLRFDSWLPSGPGSFRWEEWYNAMDAVATILETRPTLVARAICTLEDTKKAIGHEHLIQRLEALEKEQWTLRPIESDLASYDSQGGEAVDLW